NCKARHRADKLIESALDAKGIEMVVDGLSFDQMAALIKEHDIKCPDCGSADFTEIRQFNLMFKTFQGVTESSTNEIYLRPETA
ncbi:glycine--tRNA ligase, partial [Shewanella sp. C31]|nr:glycine--tRNA ligase [Shewanella electrica]